MGKRKDKPRHNPKKRAVGLFVRGVGCKGTSIDLTPGDGDRIRVVVADANCEDETFITKDELRQLLGE